jgi:hypothetical protein
LIDMALARLSMKFGKVGKAAAHAAYIAREAQYARRLHHGEGLEAKETGNLPAWADTEPNRFWQAADTHERVNGTTYREMEIALPRELSPAQRLALVRGFVQQELGSRHAYQWAIHNPNAADGHEQPHVHLMFSERRVDGIDRDPNQYFRRHNPKAPEKGGAKKGYGPYSGGYLSAAERVAHLKGLRQRWEIACNAALERAGRPERIDMRSHLERGLTIPPERKQLPSEWRQPETRAVVLAFRQARAEQTRTQTDLNRYLPNLEAEIAQLADARRRRETEAAREREAAAARTALERAAAGLVAALPERISFDALAYFRQTTAEAATPAQAESNILKVIADSLSRRLEKAGFTPLPEPEDPLLAETARRCYGPVMARVEALEAECRAAGEWATAQIQGTIATLDSDAARPYQRQAEETAEAHRGRLTEQLQIELRDRLQTTGQPVGLPEADLAQAGEACANALLDRLAQLAAEERARNQRRALDRLAAAQAVLIQRARTLAPDAARSLHRHAQESPEAHRGRLTHWLHRALRRLFDDRGGGPLPPVSAFETAVRPGYEPLLARLAELAAGERAARERRGAQEAEHQRLLAIDLQALLARRDELKVQAQYRLVPTARELVEHWAGVAEARHRLNHATHRLAALEAEDARWKATHPLGSRLGHLSILRGPERRELDGHLRDARQERQQAEDALDAARRQAVGHLPHAKAKIRELQDANTRIPELQRQIEQLDQEITAATAAQADARYRREKLPSQPTDAADPANQFQPDGKSPPSSTPAPEPSAARPSSAPASVTPTSPIPPPRPKPRHPAPGG